MKEAAARPVVCWAALYAFAALTFELVVGVEGVATAGDVVPGLDVIDLRFLVRVLAISAGFWRRAKISAALPKAFVLTFPRGSFRSRCCSDVKVLVPSLRYLKELRLRDSTF